MIISINHVHANTVKPTEYELKAAFIYNFTKFINWPAESFEKSDAPINLCLLGNDPFGNAIDMLKDKLSKGRQFTVNRIPSSADVKIETLSCHILFISPSEEKKLPHIFSLFKSAAVLTISDMHNFAELGGIIGFKMKGKRIGFAINNEVATKAKLKISSELLKLSDVVGR